MYHLVLRTSALTLALVLLFVSGIVSPLTKQLSIQTEQYLASVVGASASVTPNGLNEVTAALTARETNLHERENALRERELSLGLQNGGAPSNDYTVYILSVILFILLVLIVMNYILDFMRNQSPVTTSRYGTMT